MIARAREKGDWWIDGRGERRWRGAAIKKETQNWGLDKECRRRAVAAVVVYLIIMRWDKNGVAWSCISKSSFWVSERTHFAGQPFRVDKTCFQYNLLMSLCVIILLDRESLSVFILIQFFYSPVSGVRFRILRCPALF